MSYLSRTKTTPAPKQRSITRRQDRDKGGTPIVEKKK